MSIIFRTLHQDLHSRAKKLVLVQIFEENHSKPYLRTTAHSKVLLLTAYLKVSVGENMNFFIQFG